MLRQSICRLSSRSKKQHYDVAIIGGGHNALISACYLSKSNKKVIVLEKAPQFGGATQSVYAFEGVKAKLSRYSYLVALFPDRIKNELELDFETLRRCVSWYATHEDAHRGVLLNRDNESKSIEEIAGKNEVLGWETFYEKIGQVAEVLAPTMLEPLKSEEEIRSLIGEEAWKEFVEQPLSVTLDTYFTNDLIKGVVLTDGLIGTFTNASDKLANICFLYHLIGNGTGDWRVPVGGMGALLNSIVDKANELGVDLKTDSEVANVDVSDTGVLLTTSNGDEYSAELLLSGAAPAVLEKLSGIPSTTSCRDGSQVKMNMVLERLPQLKSGIDPNLAFAGTFHINEHYSQLERAYTQAAAGEIPDIIPAEIYCHTLADTSILDDEMVKSGNHTLTLFALHTPAFLFDEDTDKKKELVTKRILEGLNQHLVEPIETLLLKDIHGKPCLEVKIPQELEKEIGLPRGNIFHGDLSWPWQHADEHRKWGVETSHDRVFIASAGAVRGGGVSGIGGHNAAMAALERLDRMS